MISASALTLLVWFALGCCILTPVVLLGAFIIDAIKGEIW